jgi:hypothetical protein
MMPRMNVTAVRIVETVCFFGMIAYGFHACNQPRVVTEPKSCPPQWESPNKQCADSCASLGNPMTHFDGQLNECDCGPRPVGSGP